MRTYREFLINRTQVADSHGFDPVWMPDFLFDFQRHLVEWGGPSGSGGDLCRLWAREKPHATRLGRERRPLV